MHTLSKTKQTYAQVDLFCVVYAEDICQKIARGISKLVKQIASFSERTLKLIEQCFKTTSVGFKAGQIDIKVEFGKTGLDPISQLENLLEGLEQFAKKHKQPVVLFLDEFQDVLKADASNKIQAVIRSVAQHAKYVTYIFSGSSRKMLSEIFEDKKQPLYMLCSKITLERIEMKHLHKHIQQAAKKRWHSILDETVVAFILQLTEAHPYYVNLLCDKLWELAKKPSKQAVQRGWDQALHDNLGKVIADLEPLNTNRMKVLSTIALLGSVNAPNSTDFLNQVNLPLSSTQHAVLYLIQHDFLFEAQNGLTLVDPIIKKFIVERLR